MWHARSHLFQQKNEAARLAWCKAHENWTTEQWRKVLWSDESTFTQFRQNRTSRVWRQPKDEWSSSCPSRMHWGCFSWHGVGPIVPIEGSVTGASYTEILRKYAVRTIRHMFPEGDSWFQHDNARPHTSKVATAFIASSCMAGTESGS